MSIRASTAMLLLAAMVPLSATAQEPEPAAAAHLGSVRHAVSLVQDGDVVTAVAWDYQAEFSRAGMRYVPALGGRAPATQHLALTPVAVGRSGNLRSLPESTAAPTFTGHRLTHRHAPGVAEIQDLGASGVQISWHFAAPMPGSGDLVVRYRLESTLPVSRRSADHLSFDLPGVGGIGIGAVTGIDAAGRRSPGQLHLDGPWLELRLPATFVDTARYPLVLDPLIGTEFPVGGAIDNDSQPDVAYDVTQDAYLVVYRRVYSITFAAIFAQRVAGDGGLLGGPQNISGNNVIAGHPTVANVALRDTFVVAWEQSNSLLETRDIRCEAVFADGSGHTNAITIASGLGEQVHPDAAGDNTTGDDEVLIAYEDTGAGIKLAMVTVPANQVLPVLQATRTLTTSTSAASPAISKSQPSAGTYLALWTEVAGGVQRLQAQAVDRNGNLRGTVLAISAPESLGNPDVDGDGTDFVVVYDRIEASANNSERDVHATSLRWNGTTLTQVATRGLDTRPGTDQKQPAVTFCRYKFVVAWADQFLPDTNNYDLRGAEIAANCADCGGRMLWNGVNGSPSRNVEFWPAIASRYGGGDASDDALLVFAEADDAPPFTSSVLAQHIDALGPGGAIQTVGTSCGAPGTIGTTGGPFAVGNTDFAVTLSGLPLGAATFLLLGFRGNERSCGSCTYVDYIAVEFVAPVGRNATHFHRVPCSSYPLVGFTTQVQWVVFGTASSPCPTLPGVAMTSRLWLPLVP